MEDFYTNGRCLLSLSIIVLKILSDDIRRSIALINSKKINYAQLLISFWVDLMIW